MRTPTARASFIGMAVLLAFPAVGHAQRVIYVDSRVVGTLDGTSWATAYADLQDALDDARSGGDSETEIWIAEGTYRPDGGTKDQLLAFELFGSVALYGGFAGWEECREQRDWRAHVTILSADLAGDDDPGAQPQSDCCLLTDTPTCSDLDCRAIVIAANPPCATRWKQSCAGTALDLCCELCRPTRCDNANNVLRATEPDSNPVIDGLTIVGAETNSPGHTYFRGGLYGFQANPIVTNCTFTQNHGGTTGVYVSQGTPIIRGTAFTDNYGVAAEIANAPAPFLVEMSTFSRNQGMGLWVLGSNGTIRGCTFTGNPHGINCSSATCTIENSWIIGNGLGVSLFGYARIFNSYFLQNSPNGIFADGTVLVVDSVFAGNRGGFAAALESRSGFAYVLNSTFFGNSADHVAGIGVGGGATIVNSVFWGNSDAGGLTEQAQISWTDFPPDLRNNIVQGWVGDYGGVGNSGQDPVFVDPSGPDGVPGTEDDDLRLLPGSPAINAGDPAFVPQPGQTDLDGHPRVLCGRVDIGAYEFGIGDFNCDQTVDLTDFAAWPTCMTGPFPPLNPQPSSPCIAFDFNADTAIDLYDLYMLENILTTP